MKKNLRLMKKVLSLLKTTKRVTNSELEHVNLLFMVAGSSTADDLWELTDDLPAGNLPLLKPVDY